MHAQNQISLTHKILYGIMSLAVFLAAFGAGNLPPAAHRELPRKRQWVRLSA